MKVIKLTSLQEPQLKKVKRKVRELCEQLASIVIYNAELTVSMSTQYVAMAIILLARKKSNLTPIWPEELDYMVFGPKVSKNQQ